MNEKLVKVGAEPTAVEKRLVRTLLDRWDTDNGYPLDDLIADMRVVLAGAHQDALQVAPVEPTEPDAWFYEFHKPRSGTWTQYASVDQFERRDGITDEEWRTRKVTPMHRTPQVEPTRAALEELVAVRDIKNGWIARALTGEVPTQEDIDIEDFREVAAWEAARAALGS